MYQRFFKVLLITSLVALATSCGSSSSSRSTHNNDPSGNDPSGIATLTPKQGPIAFNIAGLHIQSDYGIECYSHEAWWFPTERANIVLADSTRLHYDGPEVQKMKEFAIAYFTGKLYYPGKPYPSLPSTLRYAWGSTGLFVSNLGLIGCFEEIDLTNMRQDTIEIQAMNIRLTAAPQSNKEQYRLIDVCSLLPSSILQQLGGCQLMKGGGSISYYYFHLKPDNAGHIFSPQASKGAYPLPNNLNTILKPHDSEYIDLVFDSSPNSMIYPVVPVLTISTSNGSQSIDMPQLAGKLYFADRSQFSCYTLQGNDFVKEANMPGSGPLIGNKGACV